MEEVYDALEKINESQRDCIVMKYLQEFDTKEISQITGKNEANIRKILSRGLKKLTEILTNNKRIYE